MASNWRDKGAVTTAMNLAERLQRLRGANVGILQACMPKSGSTLLAAHLASVGGLRRISISDGGAGNAQDLSRARLLDARRLDYVAQHHVLATRGNCRLIDRHQLKVIVQTRDVADALVSLRDHLVDEGTRVPTCYVQPAFGELSALEQYDFVVHVAAPWFLAFIASWQSPELEFEPMWVGYADVVADPAGVADQLLDRLGVESAREPAPAPVQNGPGRRGTRLNVGTPGRGRELLSDRQFSHLGRLAELYRVREPGRFGLD